MHRSTYQLLDSGHFKKLERVGDWLISRPSPQAVWHPKLPESEWANLDAYYTRYSGGDGKWTIRNPNLSKKSVISYGGLSLQIQMTDFGHLGLFAEQANNWQKIREAVKGSLDQGSFKVLNLFAYTGGSSLAAAQAGAEVTHVDASKTSVAWARDNARVAGMEDYPIRWLVEDVQKFVAREIRRGNKYHGIILDPPSYGRGAKGEVWKIEEHLVPLLNNISNILAQDFSFILLSAHSTGYTPIALQNLISSFAPAGGVYESGEMLVGEDGGDRFLPSGNYCLFKRV
ncbi:MAG: SAM-dependent methyltransferase [Zetaproteobacteria bacterium]|nr:SAM-dependent methyltransferase [Pseudobdellovibrionaceae bacterium]